VRVLTTKVLGALRTLCPVSQRLRRAPLSAVRLRLSAARTTRTPHPPSALRAAYCRHDNQGQERERRRRQQKEEARERASDRESASGRDGRWLFEQRRHLTGRTVLPICVDNSIIIVIIIIIIIIIRVAFIFYYYGLPVAR
jgi:hypothetical protein